ncbi:MAG: hypothetical protein ABJD11_06060 [Gemmatimonadota bacterium]
MVTIPAGTAVSFARSRFIGAAVLASLAFLSLSTRTLQAQDSVIVIDPDAPASDTVDRGGLPPEILNELLRVFNDTSTVRLSGNFTLPATGRLVGTVAVYRGTVRIGGTVEGPLTVINGDLVILPGGDVRGDILLAGGRLSKLEGGTHEGSLRVYWDAAQVTRTIDGELVVRERRRPLGDLASAQKSFQTGRIRTTLLLATNQTYNRIEGLPVIFGPAFDWRASDRTFGRVELRGILRTAGDNSSFRRDFGYSLRTDWRFSGLKGYGFGLRAYDLVEGIEEQSLPRDEIGWSAFLLQRDNRDYFLTQGAGGHLFGYLSHSLRLEASARYENESSVRATDPWSLFRNSDRWRPNPLIDDGHYTILGGALDLDTRNSRDNTTVGWWVRARYEHASTNDVAPANVPTAVRSPLPTNAYKFDHFSLDARRYNRLSPSSRVDFRLWAGGWLAGDPLPVQRRLSLGGIDMLPGYSFRRFTCAPAGLNDPAATALCDRAIILQAEFRSRLSLGLGYSYRDPQRRDLDRFIGINEADLVIFADGGDTWLSGNGPGRVPSNRIPSLKEWKGDVGVGLDAGGIGAYLAKALTDGQPLRFFVRLQRRF